MSATDIGTLCEQRGWSRSTLIQEMRRYAKIRGKVLPDDRSLSRMIRMWNSGERGLKDYVDLLSDVFGVSFSSGKSASPKGDMTRRTIISAAALVAASARQSTDLVERLALTVDPLAIEQMGDDATRLSIEYMSRPPIYVAQETKLLRDRIMLALERTSRLSQIHDLYVLAAQASGILAYAALDLGNVTAALTNARSALMCADAAGNTDFAIWVRGTQSLIARFAGRYHEAENYLSAGMQLRPSGANLARLAAGYAQCRAQLGDESGTRSALTTAVEAHSTSTTSEAVGLFGFARSKVHYYAASSLVCLPNATGCKDAVQEAHVAIDLFRNEPAEQRFLTDEILVHIHAANAYLQQGHVDAATEVLQPVFQTPADQRVSWHRQRLSILGTLLASPRFQNVTGAKGLETKLASF